MKHIARAMLALTLLVAPALADVQELPPGTADQNAVVVNSGANGVCETAAVTDDVALALPGQVPPNRAEIRCGANKIADTTAAGDDVQLIAVGGTCRNANAVAIDTGPNGIADSTAAVDDVQIVPTGTAPVNSPCILTGANGIADTPDPVGGDDNRLIPFGTAAANQPVVRCGPNLVAETTANNVGTPGDDVQLLPVGSACASANTIVVDSGANGISDTLAEGSDLVIKVLKPTKINIAGARISGSKTLKVVVTNVETGASAPPARTYRLVVRDGGCPGGSVTNVDADGATPGLQAVASVPRGRTVHGSFVVTLKSADVPTVSSRIPFRCTVNVEADIDDLALGGEADDAANVENNATSVTFDVVDRNDL